MTSKSKAIEVLEDLDFINQFVLRNYDFALITTPQFFNVKKALSQPTLDDAIKVVEAEVDRLLHGIDRKSHIECHEATIILTALKELKERE